MATSIHKSLLLAVTLVVGVLAIAGCEDPFIDPYKQGAFYTVWGYLSTFEDTHYVRVVPVRRFPETINRPGDPHAEIDAQVWSEDLQTGVIRIWRHELRRLDDGTYGHIFWTTFTVREGATYRLRVVRSDDVFSTAEITIPTGFDYEVLPARNVDGSVIQTIRWKDAPTPEHMDVVYCAGRVGSSACDDGADGGGFLVRYNTQGRRVGNDWEVDVDLSRDFEMLRSTARLDPDEPLELYSLQMRLNALDPGWRVLADPNAFAQPTALDNIVGGFGYWGAIGNSVADWFPESEAIEELLVTPAPFGG